jgi:disulfide bond formation protein DsbB
MQRIPAARAVALLVPLALLAGAWSFQIWGGLFPCEMCWWQRYALIAALGFAVLAWVLRGARWPLLLAGIALLVSAGLGFYHAGIEYRLWHGVTACTSAVQFGHGDPLDAIMGAPAVRCDEVQWQIFGISLAGFNFLISGAAALAVLVLGLTPRRSRL